MNPRDQHHGAATAYAADFRGEIVTTEWVLMEVADALADAPRLRPEVVALIRRFPATIGFRLIPADPILFRRGLEHYSRRPDKAWSLTDCTSFVVMSDERIFDALTEDHHFDQAGFTAVFAR